MSTRALSCDWTHVVIIFDAWCQLLHPVGFDPPPFGKAHLTSVLTTLSYRSRSPRSAPGLHICTYLCQMIDRWGVYFPWDHLVTPLLPSHWLISLFALIKLLSLCPAHKVYLFNYVAANLLKRLHECLSVARVSCVPDLSAVWSYTHTHIHAFTHSLSLSPRSPVGRARLCFFTYKAKPLCSGSIDDR